MSRGTSPALAVALLALVTLSAGAGLLLVVPDGPAEQPPGVRLTLTASAADDTIALTHEGGATLDVSALTLRVSIDGEPLAHQPPVPFFAAEGFVSGPTGPFNPGSDQSWRAGQTATITLATTNRPPLTGGARVAVTVRTDAGVVAELSTTTA